MKIRYYLLYLTLFLLPFFSNAQVVINEVYGGGGNFGATFTNDFVELYNNGSTEVNIGGWIVEYYSSTGIVQRH